MMPATGKTHPREHGWGVHNNLDETYGGSICKEVINLMADVANTG
jgi:hypothetical protein